MLGCKVRLNRKWIALAGLGSTLYRPLDGALNQIEFVRTKYKTDARLQIKRILNVSRLEVRSIRSQYNPVQIRSIRGRCTPPACMLTISYYIEAVVPRAHKHGAESLVATCEGMATDDHQVPLVYLTVLDNTIFVGFRIPTSVSNI